MPKTKIPVSTLRRGLPQISIDVTDITLKETERHGNYADPTKDNRADVYFEGTMTVNDRVLPCEVHLFRIDKKGWQAGSWYVTMSVNERKNWREGVAPRDVVDAFPEHCHECHKDSYVGKAFAKATFPILQRMGFSLASGIGAEGSKSDWWLMDVSCDSQGERKAMNARTRMFYYKQRRLIVCPIHGEFIQETEESSL